MKKAIVILLLATAAWARGADPYVGYIYPCGIQAGATNRLIVGGQGLGGVKDAVVSGEGVEVLSIEMVPRFPPAPGPQFRYLAKWLDGIARGDRAAPPLPTNPKAHVDEWRSNKWWRVLGELDEQKLSIVERALYIRPNRLQSSPSLNQSMLVTVAVAPDEKPGVREFRVLGPNGMSAPRPFIVTAAPREAEALWAPKHRPRPPAPAVTNLPCVLDGQIMPGQTDTWTLHLQKGRTVTLSAVARELQPYIGDAVPGFFNPALRIVDADGAEVAFADDNFYHPDPVLVFTPPADGDYKLEVHDLLYRGRADFVYAITVEAGAHPVDPRRVSLWPNPVPQPPPDVPCTTFTGVIARPGVPSDHVFEVKEAGEYVFDVLARRVGSPLDARVSVLGSADDKPIAVFPPARGGRGGEGRPGMVVHAARASSRALVRGVDGEVVLRLPSQEQLIPDEGVRGAQRRIRRSRGTGRDAGLPFRAGRHPRRHEHAQGCARLEESRPATRAGAAVHGLGADQRENADGAHPTG